MPRSPPLEPPARSLPAQLSVFVGYFRWLYMPLGLFSLVAVGVHAAADTLDDRAVRLVEQADALLDGWFAAWSVTQPLVNWITPETCTWLARVFTFGWELAADVVLALPALGYRELGPVSRRLTGVGSARTWRAMIRSMVTRPTPLRLLRPAMTAAVVLAGTCAVARMVEGVLYLRFAPDDLSKTWARLGAIATLVLVLATFGWRAVLRSLQHADGRSEDALAPLLALSRGRRFRTVLRAARTGLVGALIAAPVALAALLDASPLLSFFR